MSEPLICRECMKGHHSICSGDFSTTTVITCRCAFCKSYVDDHGPFARVPDVAETPEATT